jgi:2-hydroxy-6-oxonona-2,4-dienedioate hydrolase
VVSIYLGPEGRAEMAAVYERRLGRLRLPVRSRTVETRFGTTHLLEAGPPDGAPLVLVPGANGCALDFAEPFAALAAERRCFFLDVVGEPNRSSEVRPSKEDHSLGHWLVDVLDGLGVERAAMLGMSGGGYAIVMTGAVAPERIERAALIVPEGFCRADDSVVEERLTRPIARFREDGDVAWVRAFTAATWSPDAFIPGVVYQATARLLRSVHAGPRFGRLLDDGELDGMRAPVLLIAGGADVIFPGELLVARARELLPNLTEAHLLPDAGHIDVRYFIGDLLQRMAAFVGPDPDAR